MTSRPVVYEAQKGRVGFPGCRQVLTAHVLVLLCWWDSCRRPSTYLSCCRCCCWALLAGCWAAASLTSTKRSQTGGSEVRCAAAVWRTGWRVCGESPLLSSVRQADCCVSSVPCNSHNHVQARCCPDLARTAGRSAALALAQSPDACCAVLCFGVLCSAAATWHERSVMGGACSSTADQHGVLPAPHDGGMPGGLPGSASQVLHCNQSCQLQSRQSWLQSCTHMLTLHSGAGQSNSA